MSYAQRLDDLFKELQSSHGLVDVKFSRGDLSEASLEAMCEEAEELLRELSGDCSNLKPFTF